MKYKLSHERYLISLLFICSVVFAKSADQVYVMPHTGNIATFGQVDLSQSAAVKNALPLANGGTNATSLSGAISNLLGATSLGDIFYGSGTNTIGHAVGNTSATTEYLCQTGTGSASAAPAWCALGGPARQVFYITTSTQGYWFTLSSPQSVSVGAVYTDGTHNYTALNTISSQIQFFATGTSAPSGGTLTKSSGTGPSSMGWSGTPSALQSFSISSGVTWTKFTVIGDGGGGGGTASSASTAGAGGGGGGGGTMEVVLLNQGGSTVYVAVGSGGLGGTAGANAGATGQGSAVANANGFIVALGGHGGFGSTAITSGVNQGGTGGLTSTNFSSGTYVFGNGGVGCAGQIFSATAAIAGCGGSSSLSGQVAPSVSTTAAGQSASTYGAGGTGGIQVSNGGAEAGGQGAGGLVYIDYAYQ